MRQAEHTEEGIFMPDKDPGINRFSREECAYLLSFTESLHNLPKDDYSVSFFFKIHLFTWFVDGH